MFTIDEIFAEEESEKRKTNLFHWQELYPDLPRKPYRLSNSSIGTLLSCPRKFDLFNNKNIGVGLSVDEFEPDTSLNNVHLDFGKAAGIGIQTLLTTGDLDKAIFRALYVYNYVEDEQISKSKNDLSMILVLEDIHKQWDYSEWEIISNEASFKIILNRETQDYFCGYVDAIIRNKHTGVYCILEVKTTGVRIRNLNPLYQNSPQALGYSVILDAVVPDLSSWISLYLVAQFTGSNIIPTIHILPFDKSKRDRLEWLLNLQLHYSQIQQYQEISYWPKHGDKCLTFNRPCKLLGLCDLTHDTHEYLIKQEDTWDHVFYLEDLINQQMER